MSFGAGKSAAVYVNGTNLSSYLNAMKVKLGGKVHDTTTFGKNSECFVAGLMSGGLTASGLVDISTSLNTGSDTVHDVFRKALGSSTDSIWEHFPFGDTLGALGQGMRCKGTTYGISGVIADLVRCNADGISSSQWHAIISLLALAAKTNTFTGTSVDNGASSLTGGAGYFQCTAFSGTSIAPKIQHSSDNSSWNDLLTFTTVSAANISEVVEVTGTINRYTRCVGTGTFVATCHFALGRNS